jgi:hypothetical protein
MARTAWWSVTAVILGMCSGCSMAPLPSPFPSPAAPFFRATSEDTTQLAALAAELDSAALECASAETR